MGTGFNADGVVSLDVLAYIRARQSLSHVNDDSTPSRPTHPHLGRESFSSVPVDNQASLFYNMTFHRRLS